MQKIITLILIFVFPILLVQCGGNITYEAHFKSWVCQYENIDIDALRNTNFEIVVIDYANDSNEFTSEEIESLKSSGKIVLAYLNIGRAEDWRFYWDTLDKNIVNEEDPDWPGEYYVDFWDDRWWEQALKPYIDKIISQGFNGLFLDRIDAFQDYERPEDMKNLVLRIKNYIPSDMLITALNAEDIIQYLNPPEEYLNAIDFLAVESLFYKGTEKRTYAYIKYRVSFIRIFQNNGIEILSLDYVDDGTGYTGENKTRIDDYLELCSSNGFVPYVARNDVGLSLINIIPGIQE
ncbi:MAG: hypothetical protein PWQ20_893 [Thermotogaceae bacterium]|nr:hypothetical protein [Thermotogaceae bacterium]